MAEVDTGFGPAIGDGRSLDLNLASFDEDLNQRGEPRFIRIAREAGGTGPVDTGFGPAIGDGRSLDLSLASFNEDLSQRGEPLFIRIAREASVAGPDFSDAAVAPPAPFDPLGGDRKKPSNV